MKSRKVLTILLSLAIMFTFMPAMAFADTAAASIASWGTKLATVTDTNGRTFETKRYFDETYGYIEAVPQDDTSVTGDTKYAPTSSGYFYDFDGSLFVNGASSSGVAIDGKSFTQEYAQNSLAIAIRLVEPSYTEAAKATGWKAATMEYEVDTGIIDTDEDAEIETITIGNYTYAVWQSAYESGSETDQNVTIYVKSIDSVDEVDVTDPDTADADGTVAEATITVKGVDKEWDTAYFYLDSKDGAKSTGYNETGNETLTGLYNGSAQTIVADDVPGWTVAYQVYDSKAGKYGDSTTSVSITDVQTTDIKIKATFTKTSDKTTKTRIFKVNLKPAQAKIGFSLASSVYDSSCYYKVSGTEYNAADYLAIDDFQFKASEMKDMSSEDKKLTKIKNAANAAAAKANSSELMSLFNDVFDIKATVTKAKPNNVDLSFEDKDLTSAEEKAIETKYATLMLNYAFADFDDVVDDLTGDSIGFCESVICSTATVELNADAVDDKEVTFTKAVSSKTYKGSKTTKKGKLKKNQTIQFTAEAANGKAVTYKLINVNTSKITIDKSTGLVTLKKGLAKGTYKFVVKAYVPGDNEKSVETQNVTIKVKK